MPRARSNEFTQQRRKSIIIKHPKSTQKTNYIFVQRDGLYCLDNSQVSIFFYFIFFGPEWMTAGSSVLEKKKYSCTTVKRGKNIV